MRESNAVVVAEHARPFCGYVTKRFLPDAFDRGGSMKPNNTLFAVAVLSAVSLAQSSAAPADKIAAQQVTEEIAAAHPEITSLEIAATNSQSEGCKTIAATEAKEV